MSGTLMKSNNGIGIELLQSLTMKNQSFVFSFWVNLVCVAFCSTAVSLEGVFFRKYPTLYVS